MLPVQKAAQNFSHDVNVILQTLRPTSQRSPNPDGFLDIRYYRSPLHNSNLVIVINLVGILGTQRWIQALLEVRSGVHQGEQATSSEKNEFFARNGVFVNF